jgi:curved DNA-binding protein CbpA
VVGGIFREEMTDRERRDPYVVLGVGRRASPDEISRAYRRAAWETHPDGGGSGAGAERFQAVSDAYEVLRDPGRRADYDRLHPLPRAKGAGAESRSVRYAAPGAQHLVLGSRPQSAAVGAPFVVGDLDELTSVQGLSEIEELIHAVLSLLRSG